MQLALLLANADEGGANLLVSFLPLIVIGFVMWFLLLRPQRKKMREQAQLQAAVKVGDEVITTSGVYGFITGEDDDMFWLEIDDDVQIRIAKAAIQRSVDTSASGADDEPDDADSADDDTADVDES